MPGFHRPLRSATLVATALLAVGLAGCGSTETSHTGTHGGAAHRPVTTSDADWKSVTDALGRTGKFGDSNTVTGFRWYAATCRWSPWVWRSSLVCPSVDT
jgi:hypothetical protein